MCWDRGFVSSKPLRRRQSMLGYARPFLGLISPAFHASVGFRRNFAVTSSCVLGPDTEKYAYSRDVSGSLTRGLTPC